MDLNKLRIKANGYELLFEDECNLHGYRDKWEAYRAETNGIKWPIELEESHNKYIAALHEFYIARDGENGFLGSRGL